MQPLKGWLVTLLLSAVAIPAFGQSLVVNELMQSNVDVVFDKETHDFPDSWIELYNNGPIPVSLSEYQIGTKIDDHNNPVEVWQLPIAPAHCF